MAIMSEPKFSDAPCYGKEFNATSRICNVCLANKPCQRKFYRQMGAGQAQGPSLLDRSLRTKQPPQPVLT